MFNAVVRKWVLCLLFFTFFVSLSIAQQRRDTVPASRALTGPPSQAVSSPFGGRTGPKPYREVITSKAISTKGLFTVHRVEDKWYFEIGDSLIGRDILIVNRLSKAGAGM